MNWLRSTQWFRSGVILQKTLTDIGYSRAQFLVEDCELAKDLIEADREKFERFSKEVLNRDSNDEDDEESDDEESIL